MAKAETETESEAESEREREAESEIGKTLDVALLGGVFHKGAVLEEEEDMEETLVEAEEDGGKEDGGKEDGNKVKVATETEEMELEEEDDNWASTHVGAVTEAMVFNFSISTTTF